MKLHLNLKNNFYFFGAMSRSSLLLALLVFSCAKVEANYFQYWQQAAVTEYEKGNWEIYSSTKGKFINHSYCFIYFRYSPIEVKYKLNKVIDLEAHYSFIESRDFESEFFYWHRFEFEANPTWKLSPCVTFKVRNRYELIKVEDDNKLQNRYRFRPTITIDAGPCCWFETWKAFYEIIYSITRRRIVETRFCPVEIKINLSEKVSVSPFLLWENRRFETFWIQSIVLGTKINF